ncbi:MAG: YggS family pyridoxal phosphate-dependent enzyme [Chthonomonadales bacterium]
MSSIANNIAEVRARIARAALSAGRDPKDITLVAVSKTVDTERIREAWEAGITDFGENYYQEVRTKMQELPRQIRWHFIGHLQTNKAKYIAGRFALVQSVDREELAEELGRRANAAGCTQPVLVEVKLDPAATKHGVPPDQTIDFCNRVRAIPGLQLTGLMGMAPLLQHPEQARPYFAELRRIFERLPEENRRVLSMGMSADFDVAIQEGSTMVRVGTAIFGARQ